MGVSVSAAHLLEFGDLFSIRGVKSDADQDLILAAYQFPLNDSGTRLLKFNYTYSEQTLGGGLDSLEAGGRTKVFNVEVAENLSRDKTSQFGVRAGFDFRRYRNFQLGATSSFDKISDVYIAAGGFMTDSYSGQTIYDFKLQRGISGTDQDSSLASRVDGDASIAIASWDLTRFQSTNYLNSYFILKANGQFASNRGLSPDRFAVGGYGTVRGFPLAEISADWGYNLAMEYVLPFPFPFQNKGWHRRFDPRSGFQAGSLSGTG